MMTIESARLRATRAETLAVCAMAHGIVCQLVAADRDPSALRRRLAETEDALLILSRPWQETGE